MFSIYNKHYLHSSICKLNNYLPIISSFILFGYIEHSKYHKYYLIMRILVFVTKAHVYGIIYYKHITFNEFQYFTIHIKKMFLNNAI